MAGVDTNTGGVTAVEAWTGITVAARNVFTAKVVVDSLTADIHRQTVAVAWMMEVGFRAGTTASGRGVMAKGSRYLPVNYKDVTRTRSRGGRPLDFRGRIEATLVSVTVAQQ